MPKNNKVPDIIAAGGDSIGLRCPDHPKTLEFLRLLEVPVAAPSANLSSMPSPKSAKEVLDYFEGKIECVIDGGVCELGVESALVLLSSQPGYYKIIRQGALAEKDIKAALRMR